MAKIKSDFLKSMQAVDKIELTGRQLLHKKLQTVVGSLDKTLAKETEKRATRTKQLCQYESEDDVQNAYGYGEISQDEHDALIKQLESGEAYVNDTVTAARIAKLILSDFLRELSGEIASLEFDLLSPDEQERRRIANEELHNKINELRQKRQK